MISLFKYCFRDSFPELQGGTREMSKIFFDKIPVLYVSNSVNEEFAKLIDDIQREYTKEKAIQIDERLFDLYGLTNEERQTIGFVEIGRISLSQKSSTLKSHKNCAFVNVKT